MLRVSNCPNCVMRQHPFSMPSLPPMVKWLLIANGIGFVAESYYPGLFLTFALWPLGDNVVPTAHGLVVAPSFQIWQLLTYGFLHAGFPHLFFNMFGLWMFGRAVEMAGGGGPSRWFSWGGLGGAPLGQWWTRYFSGTRLPSPTAGP